MFRNITRNFKQFINFFNKTSVWCKATLIIIIILFCTTIVNRNRKEVEAFTQSKKFVMKTNNTLYDDFYCSIYDDLFYDDKKYAHQVTNIERIAKINKNSNILDIGCGTGHFVSHYKQDGKKIEGLDKSKSMIKCARKHYKGCNFKHGDVLKSMTYEPNTFTHALAFFYTLYYIEDKHLFFKNVKRITFENQRNTLDKWYSLYEEKSDTKETPECFECLLDDLNTPEYISNLHELYNAALKGDNKKKDSFNNACRLIGIFNEDKNNWEKYKRKSIKVSETFIIKKINERLQARKNGDFKLADKIRDELLKEGVLIEDKKDNTEWKYK